MDNDIEAINEFEQNIPANRKTWNAPEGYVYFPHQYHHFNKGRNDEEFAPRKGSKVQVEFNDKVIVIVKGSKKPNARVIHNKKITWNNFGKGRGYTVYTHMLIKMSEGI